MSIKVKPTRIKQSVYLLVPKDIADLVDINKNSTFSLKVRKNGKKSILEYSF